MLRLVEGGAAGKNVVEMTLPEMRDEIERLERETAGMLGRVAAFRERTKRGVPEARPPERHLRLVD